MACLSKLDRHLKEKLKYIIIIMRKIRRHRVFERQKAKKGMGIYKRHGNIQKQKFLWQSYSKNFMPTKSYYFCLLYFKNTNFRTFELSNARDVGILWNFLSRCDKYQIFWYSKYCDKADKGDSNTIRTIRKRSHYAISTISYYRIAIIALIAKWEPSFTRPCLSIYTKDYSITRTQNISNKIVGSLRARDIESRLCYFKWSHHGNPYMKLRNYKHILCWSIVKKQIGCKVEYEKKIIAAVKSVWQTKTSWILL